MTNPNLGKTIDQRYQVLCELGQDDSTITYKVKHLLMGRVVLLKILKEDHLNSEQDVARFRQESDTVYGESEGGDAFVHDAGVTESGRPYFVTAITEGDEQQNAGDLKPATVAAARSKKILVACLALMALLGAATVAYLCSVEGKIELLRAEIALADAQNRSNDDSLPELIRKLGDLYEREGEFYEAANQYKHLIDIAEAKSRYKTVAIYPLTWHIADLYDKAGDRIGSKENMKKAFVQAIRAGEELRTVGQYAPADRVYADVVAMAKDKRTGRGGAYSDELGLQVRNFLDQGKVAEADAPSVEAISVGRRFLTRDSHQLVRLMMARAELLVYEGKCQQAEKLLLEGKEKLQVNWQAGRREDTDLRSVLAAVYALEKKDSQWKDVLLDDLRITPLYRRYEISYQLAVLQSILAKIGKPAESKVMADLIKWVKEVENTIPAPEDGS